MMNLLYISEKDVYDELKSLNMFKSFGPDNVHPKLLNALADNAEFVKSITTYILNVF